MATEYLIYRIIGQLTFYFTTLNRNEDLGLKVLEIMIYHIYPFIDYSTMQNALFLVPRLPIESKVSEKITLY